MYNSLFFTLVHFTISFNVLFFKQIKQEENSEEDEVFKVGFLQQ